MATSFPGALDSLVNPQPTDNLDTAAVLHDDQHANANDAIEALEAKVGVDGSTVRSSLDYKAQYGYDFQPRHQGMKGWTYDPALASVNNPIAPAQGSMVLARVLTPQDVTITYIWVYVATAGVGAAGDYFGLYDAAGNRVAVSAALTTALNSVGVKQVALTSPVNLTGGPDAYIWVAALTSGHTTAPGFISAGTQPNINIGAAGLGRYVFENTPGRTTMPATVVLSQLLQWSATMWFGLQ